ncbi:MAG: hypothetical protein IT286_05120 [Proteobacteria bacterium]|jgi:hypothetical protein|nr:hypothetical protein [Pseudomonadota bacterium]
MKKLLAAFAVLTFAVVANATDRTGALALGYQSSFSGANAWSVKYGMASNTTLQGTVGFNIAKGGEPLDNASIGGRFLYDLSEAENSDFYTGLGANYTFNGVGQDGLTIQIPLGFEFSLANAPAVAFSAEMGASFNTTVSSPSNWSFGSNGGGVGAVFAAGAHYYF